MERKATASPTLDVSKESKQSVALAGRSVRYTIIVINRGPGSATFTLDEPVGAPVTFLNFSAPPDRRVQIDRLPPVGGEGHVLVRVRELPSGASLKFRVKVRLNTDATGILTNQVEVRPADPRSSFSLATLDLPIRSEARLHLEKVGPSTVARCSTIGYTIRLCNFGPSDAKDVLLQDQLPNGTILQRADQIRGPAFTPLAPSPKRVGFTISLFPVGSSAVFELVLCLSPRHKSKCLRNRATATSATLNPSASKANASVLTHVVKACSSCVPAPKAALSASPVDPLTHTSSTATITTGSTATAALSERLKKPKKVAQRLNKPASAPLSRRPTIAKKSDPVFVADEHTVFVKKSPVPRLVKQTKMAVRKALT